MKKISIVLFGALSVLCGTDGYAQPSVGVSGNGSVLELFGGGTAVKKYGCCDETGTKCPEGIKEGFQIKSVKGRVWVSLYPNNLGGNTYLCEGGTWKPQRDVKVCQGTPPIYSLLGKDLLELVDGNGKVIGETSLTKSPFTPDVLQQNACVRIKATEKQSSSNEGKSENKKDGPCGVNFIVYANAQGPSDDEFLFENEKAYNDAKQNLGVGKHEVSGGKVYECDAGYCGNGKSITLKPGHMHGSKKISDMNVEYKCVAEKGKQDRWVKVKEWAPEQKKENNTTGEVLTLNGGKHYACCVDADGKNCPQKGPNDAKLADTLKSNDSRIFQSLYGPAYKCVNGKWSKLDTNWCNGQSKVELDNSGYEYELHYSGKVQKRKGGDNSVPDVLGINGCLKATGSEASENNNGQNQENLKEAPEPEVQKNSAGGYITDSIVNACYTTKKCGAKNNIRSVTAAVTTVAGAVYGGAYLGAPGVALGIGSGYMIGNYLGGKMQVAYGANEYIYFDDGTCLQCDSHQIGENYECPNGTIVSNGLEFFRCKTETFGDKWYQIDLEPCSNSPIQNLKAKNTLRKVQAAVDKPMHGLGVYSGDACLLIFCAIDAIYDSQKNECVFVGGEEDKTNSCRESRPTKNGKACCALPEAVATFDEKTDKCVCTNKDDEFSINDKGNGVCTPKNQGKGDEYICSEENIVTLNAWLEKCKPNVNGDRLNKQIVEKIDELIEICNGEVVKESDFIEKWTFIVGLNPDECTALPEGDQGEVRVVNPGKDPAPKPQADEGLIKSSRESLNKISGKFKTSVWKNAEGKFNAVRLASDLTAGVVLGTTGALVTSHLVKKKQVEDGFEDLKCTVGGQVVADWGDIFQVGIK